MNHLRLLLAVLLLGTGCVQAKQTLTNNGSLAFGRFVAGTGGTITVSPAGLRTQTGGVILLPSTVSAATFTASDNVAKDASIGCPVTLPANGTVTLSNGTSTMAVDQFTSAPVPCTLSGGTRQIAVGATLTVAPNQARGNYSGSFSVTVNFQ